MLAFVPFVHRNFALNQTLLVVIDYIQMCVRECVVSHELNVQ